MSKREQKKQKLKKPSVPNRDGFARASFLFQAAHTTASHPAVSRMYMRSMDLVTKKNVLKINPHVKRSVCKKCDRLQVPGKTCSMSIEDAMKKSETFQILCQCGSKRRFPVGKQRDYELFVDRKS